MQEAGSAAATRELKKEVVLASLKCVVQPRSATYVAMPLTTGFRFLEWYRNVGRALSKEDYVIGHREKVLRPNIEHGLAIANGFRDERMARGGRTVIDPSSLELSDLTQDDYVSLWRAVIEQFVAQVILIDGWQYSVGCAHEFLIAKQNDIETCDEAERPVDLSTGAEMVERAAQELDEAAGSFHERLHDVARQILHLAYTTPTARRPVHKVA